MGWQGASLYARRKTRTEGNKENEAFLIQPLWSLFASVHFVDCGGARGATRPTIFDFAKP